LPSCNPNLSTKQNIEIVKYHIDELEYQFKSKILKIKKTSELSPLLSSVSDTTKKLKNGLIKNMIIFEEDGTRIIRPAPRNYNEVVNYLYKINDDFDELYLTDKNMIPQEAYVEYENIK
jgi:hypothetical protein